MEINCPECGQRLRVPDHLHNPRVRCRKCGAMFRSEDPAEPEPKLETGSFPEEPEPAFNEEWVVATSPEEETRRTRKKAGRGLGIIGLILFILLTRAPRILKNIFNDRPRQQAEPVRQNEEERLAIEQMLRQAQDPPFEEPPEELESDADEEGEEALPIAPPTPFK